jgi:glyoxylase-like metal-dependent hydrolase (beta-lactamase superfamily II)
MPFSSLIRSLPLSARTHRATALVLAAMVPLVAAPRHPIDGPASERVSVPSRSTVAPEANPFTDALLHSVRGLAHAVPGELPTAVGYLSVQDDSSLESDAVDSAPHTKIYQVTPVFQIRFPKGWVMVDGAYSQKEAGTNGKFFPDRFDQVVAALRGARLVVITHEHGDHVGTILLPEVVRDVAPHTLLTKQQEQTLVFKPRPGVKLDAATARRFLVVDYERLLPIAPGVVLVRAPGHTPGSQMVYVKLASGREIMLVGDVVWHMAGIDLQHQKPDSTSQQMREDRAPLEQEVGWLKHTVQPAGIAIAVSHDGTALQTMVTKGILSSGLDMSAP